MASIFSTQNLQTFLRRKYLRPPSRPPGPPGRGGRRSRSGRSPNDGRSPPEGRSPPAGRSPPELVPAVAVALVSSAMMLLKICRWSLVLGRWPLDRLPRFMASIPAVQPTTYGQRPTTNDQRRFYAVAAGVSPP